MSPMMKYRLNPIVLPIKDGDIVPGYDSLYFRKYNRKAELDKAIHTLEGIIKGVAIDNVINQEEIAELRIWYKKYKDFICSHPFSELIPVVAGALSDNILDDDEIKNILWLCNNLKTGNTYFDFITSDIQRLHGILHGILSDNIITKAEIVGLQEWIDENYQLAGIYPYDEINSIITAVLVDGVLSNDEKKLLKVLFSEFINNNVPTNIDKDELSKLRQEINISGICAVCPEVHFSNKTFCFTGISSRTTRDRIKNIIESLNGIFKNTVSKLIDYLIVGDNGNPCWVFSCYGRKIEMAVKLRKNGHSILIVHENDFWDNLDNYTDMQIAIGKEE